MNKTLLQILLDEMPKRGGWPRNAMAIVQSSSKILSTIDYLDDEWNIFDISKEPSLATDYATAIITKEQYEAAFNQAR